MSNVGATTTSELRRGLQDFAKPSDLRGFGVIAADWLVIAVAFTFWHLIASHWQSPFFRLGGWLAEIAVLANRIRGLESLTHEATHATLFRTRRWNVQLQWLYALPMLHEVRAYRSEHIVHHWRLGQDSDPAQIFFARHGVNEFPRRAAWVMFIRPLLGYHTLTWLRDRYASWLEIPQYRTPIALFWSVAAFIAVLTHQVPWMLFHWLVALNCVFPIMEFWSEVSDHAGVSATRLGLSRNNLGLAHALLIHGHRDGFHSAHHLHPAIPGHRLAAAHRYLRRAAAPGALLESYGILETFLQLRLRSTREPPAVAEPRDRVGSRGPDTLECLSRLRSSSGVYETTGDECDQT
jgi:fatty acid desaturase